MHMRLVSLLAFALLPGVVAAQSAMSVDATAPARSAAPVWDAFLGCWVNTDAPDRRLQTCYLAVPGSAGAVERRVMFGDSIVAQTRLAVSDARVPIEAEGCEGFEVTQQSTDAARIYTRGEVTCGNVRQQTSSLMTLAPRGELVRVTAVIVGDQKALMTERLAPVPLAGAPSALREQLEASQLRVRGARLATIRLLDVTQIEDALRETDPVVVEAWMVEATRDTTGFRAPRPVLQRLVASGASSGVVDMAVMLGNPEHFDVHAATADDGTRPQAFAGSAWDAMGGRNCWMSGSQMWFPEQLYWASWGYPFYGTPWHFNNFGCNSFAGFGGFGMAPFGWTLWSPWYNRFGWWDRRGVRGVAVVPVTGGSITRSIPLGRVEKGRGYAPSGTSSGTTGGAAPRDPATPRTVREPARTNAQAGSSAGSSSGSGNSGASRPRTESSSGTGRTAQPRTPDKKP
ncbi:MAG: hypothetical protein C0503_04720 [Gemmatimonas sp.]|nr:hypothetical protein [Gemmatimonas sp.]